MNSIRRILNLDWILIGAAFLISIAGLITMNSFENANIFFNRQIIWILVSLTLAISVSFIDFRFLRRTGIIVTLFVSSVAVLLLLFITGHVAKGAQSWFRLGFFSVEPADPIKLVVILLLAKYFSRRHIEIANIRHVIVSGIYPFIIFLLILIHPDFGSALIVFLIWLGMVLVSGISKKHIAIVFAIGALSFGGLWQYGLKQYQKERIINFIHPLSDVRGTGYNAYQATITVGSGQLLGKGIGYGTQSRLNFLPEYQTDFIFAAYAEEWGFIGVLFLYILFGIVIWRVLRHAMRSNSNFEMLFAIGYSIFIMSHLVVNIGMNMGLLPVTGITVPFMSYGGSHLLTEFLGMGIILGMSQYAKAAHQDYIENEILGIN